MRRRQPLFLPWLVLAAVCCLLMWLGPGEETIPLHIGWVGLTLGYGFALWPARLTILSISAYAVVTGAVLCTRAAEGVLGWQETAEIPLMSVMALVMAWHVARRQEAVAQVTAMAQAQQARLRQRERLARMYSHEMRTPLTIARGYLSLLRDSLRGDQQQEDLAVVDDELQTLERVGDRLLRMLKVADLPDAAEVDVDDLLEQVVRRWRAVADRDWVVASDVGVLHCSAERLRMCLDTLVENSVRYTVDGDRVRLLGQQVGTQVLVGVADSGPGIRADVAEAVNGPDTVTAETLVSELSADAKRQTGLGLTLVREVAGSRGGLFRAGRSAEGGALFLMLLPALRAAESRPRSRAVHVSAAG